MSPRHYTALWRPTLLTLALFQAGWAIGAEEPALALRSSHTLASIQDNPALALPGPQPSGDTVRLAPSTALPELQPRSQTTPLAPANVHWASQADQWLPGQDPCEQLGAPNWDQLSLDAALASTLCKSPTLRQALANVAEQRAALTLAETARQPAWSASVGASAARNFITGATSTRSIDTSLNLSWVLFDFGRTNADLDQARQSLVAALATQSNALLDSVRELLQIYGEAVVADATKEAAQEAEATAILTAAAAQARYDAEVGTQIDRLQAQTALAQATLTKVRAQSEWETARGKLALAMGADIAQPMRLAGWDAWRRSTPADPDLSALREEARANHPRLRSARAELSALEAQLASVKAAASGSVALSANAGHSSNWGYNGTTTTVDKVPSAGLSVTATFPLFNGRQSQAQQAQVLAQTVSREAELDRIQRDIDTQLWQAHRALINSVRGVEASERLLISAKRTQEVAQGRYKAGVGSLVDLLTAQSDLADARRQRVVALVDRLTAQTQLSLATGRLGP
jgi:outer membrane protein